MSNFQCEHCGAIISDSLAGYTTGCKHYPLEEDSECEFITCGWMCGKIFIETGLERKCNVENCYNKKETV